MGLLQIKLSNPSAGVIKPANGYKWIVRLILATVTGTSTANSSLVVGIPTINYLVLLSIASTSTSTTVNGQSGPVSQSVSGVNVTFNDYPETSSETGLDLALTNNGSIDIFILVDEVPA